MDRGGPDAVEAMTSFDATSTADAPLAFVDASPPRAAPDPDADVVAAIAAADHRGAIGLLMTRHGDAIYRFIWGMVRDDAAADDLQQQVFLEAFHGLARFERRSTIVGWLFGIARHRCLDELRRRRRREQREVDDAPEREATGRGPDRVLADHQVGAALEQCLHTLAPAARTAVLLHFHDGFTYAAIGDLSRERSGTIQQRVLRALLVLRACIEARTGGRL